MRIVLCKDPRQRYVLGGVAEYGRLHGIPFFQDGAHPRTVGKFPQPWEKDVPPITTCDRQRTVPKPRARRSPSSYTVDGPDTFAPRSLPPFPPPPRGVAIWPPSCAVPNFLL